MIRLAIMLFAIVAPTIAGSVLIAILAVPDWSAKAMSIIPISTGLSVLIAIPVSMVIANAILATKRRSI